jgi:hypothetical protein
MNVSTRQAAVVDAVRGLLECGGDAFVRRSPAFTWITRSDISVAHYFGLGRSSPPRPV